MNIIVKISAKSVQPLSKLCAYQQNAQSIFIYKKIMRVTYNWEIFASRGTWKNATRERE
jgi:hypothetical protein